MGKRGGVWIGWWVIFALAFAWSFLNILSSALAPSGPLAPVRLAGALVIFAVMALGLYLTLQFPVVVQRLPANAAMVYLVLAPVLLLTAWAARSGFPLGVDASLLSPLVLASFLGSLSFGYLWPRDIHGQCGGAGSYRYRRRLWIYAAIVVAIYVLLVDSSSLTQGTGIVGIVLTVVGSSPAGTTLGLFLFERTHGVDLWIWPTRSIAWTRKPPRYIVRSRDQSPPVETAYPAPTR